MKKKTSLDRFTIVAFSFLAIAIIGAFFKPIAPLSVLALFTVWGMCIVRASQNVYRRVHHQDRKVATISGFKVGAGKLAVLSLVVFFILGSTLSSEQAAKRRHLAQRSASESSLSSSSSSHSLKQKSQKKKSTEKTQKSKTEKNTSQVTDHSTLSSHLGSATTGLAATVLAELPVKGRAPKTGYSREQFGPAWSDVDHNGCDTRNDILRRDLVGIVAKAGTHNCVILSGTLHDPYTSQSIDFVRGRNTSSKVQIDHVVALSDAWQKGAQQLSAASRKLLANDPYNLLAVQGRANQQKSDGDAATWLPANNSFRCEYVARQIGVKKKYSLWVTSAEHDAMQRVLTTCPDQKVPADGGVVNKDALSAQASSAQPENRSSHSGTTSTRTISPRQSSLSPSGNNGEKRAQQERQSAPQQSQPAQQDSQPAPQPEPQPAPQPAQNNSGGEVYYQNCAAVRAAGKAPLYQGQPGYSYKLDRDHDGVACE